MKRTLTLLGVAVRGGRGHRGSALRHVPGGDDDLWRHGTQLSQVAVRAGRHADHRDESGLQSAGSCSVLTTAGRRGMAQCCGRRLAELQQDADLAAVLAARPDQREERRQPEGPVHLRPRRVHGLRVRPDHGEQRPDRHRRVRDLLDQPGHVRRELAHAPGLSRRRSCRPTAAPPTWTACCFAARRTVGCWPSISRPASKCGRRRSATRNAASRCRRRRSPGTASSTSAMPAETSRAARARCTRSTARPARSSGSSFSSPRSKATWSGARWASRRSTRRPGTTRRAFPSAAAGPGPRTRSISRTACCTSREAIRPPTSPRAHAKATTSSPTRSWCSTPRRATTRTISRS